MGKRDAKEKKKRIANNLCIESKKGTRDVE
jgi:hypothetical protein